MSASFINMHSESDKNRVWVSTRRSCEITALLFPPRWPRVINRRATDFASLSFRAPRRETCPSISPPSVGERFSVNHQDQGGIHNQSTVPVVVLALDSWRVPRFPGGFNLRACALRGPKSQDTLIPPFTSKHPLPRIKTHNGS